jgi:hypothetical protein
VGPGAEYNRRSAVGYVDLRERRRERARGAHEPAGFWWDVEHNPYLSMAAGLGIGITLAWISTWTPLELWPLSLVSSTVLVCRGVWQLRHWRPQEAERKPGSEKRLLMIIAETGDITPVEAALETSLTVDEAEEILSRLADRGHLLVKSRDGTLSYAIPGRRSESL